MIESVESSQSGAGVFSNIQESGSHGYFYTLGIHIAVMHWYQYHIHRNNDNPTFNHRDVFFYTVLCSRFLCLLTISFLIQTWRVRRSNHSSRPLHVFFGFYTMNNFILPQIILYSSYRSCMERRRENNEWIFNHIYNNNNNNSILL